MATDTETKQYSEKIVKLGQEIVNLKLFELKELNDYLKNEWGIEPAAGAVVAAVPGAAGAAEAAEPEKTEFDVILENFGEKKLEVIKVIRQITGLGLKEAKELVDGCPAKVKEGVSKDEAEEIKEKLEAAGAKVTLK